ncbi:Kinase protein with adenine nucleotide alpha hydrolases-like domain [Heracleum sosnowskyi]|uniref:non-specific serine/threonine protein kinase n=1 Tax=Heracleum sosnowskyi TaxID=360622 RepID=A0AAD8IVP2_9APIA|nr:Kinase protein with adenine nucleotide alpha hydrolases-like domain [Heracleum sosnowskyi]
MFPPKSSQPTPPEISPPAKVIVAVKAEKVISKTALAWTLTHVVRSGDCIILLAVFPAQKTGRKFWSLLRRDDRNDDRSKLPDQVFQISESCSQMVLQFRDQIEVIVRIKVVLGTPSGVVAAEAKRNEATWVVLDKNLKQERTHCMEELQCNIVVMKGSHPKVVRLNLGYSDDIQTPFFSASSSPDSSMSQGYRKRHSTPSSSPEEPRTSYTRSSGEISGSSSDMAYFVYEQNPLYERPQKVKHAPFKITELDNPHATVYSEEERVIALSTDQKSYTDGTPKRVIWIPQNHVVEQQKPRTRCSRNYPQTKPANSKIELHKHLQFDEDASVARAKFQQTQDHMYISSIREAVSLARTSSTPPPLCSLCQHKAPAFEGVFGLIHKGILKNGQVVAIKQLTFSGSQGDADFCKEVRVLNCAQHRNVVLLVGFCVQGKRRALVYEYICNNSLDFHLHENKRTPLQWHTRLKIAIGTARGLRYLHEDCRVGPIAHRDMRPINILLTHNFEPLVADVGLLRLHTEWDIFCEEQNIETLRYLAPEYFNDGNITEKVDIYAFGLVLLELITGQRTVELQCYKSEHCSFSENIYSLPSSEAVNILTNMHQLLDPSLHSHQHGNLPSEVQAMGQAAFLCLRQDPESRPPMSKVLRVLEGGETVMPVGLDLQSVGTRSAHMSSLRSYTEPESRTPHSRQLSH